MNWTPSQLRKFEGKKAPSRAQTFVVGQPVRFRKFLGISLPSKKNSKLIITRDRRGNPLNRPTLITKPEYQPILEAMERDLRMLWIGKPPITQAWIVAVFVTTVIDQDDDGAFASLADSLERAGVIQKDSRRHIRGHAAWWREPRPNETEGVHVLIRGYECLIKK